MPSLSSQKFSASFWLYFPLSPFPQYSQHHSQWLVVLPNLWDASTPQENYNPWLALPRSQGGGGLRRWSHHRVYFPAPTGVNSIWKSFCLSEVSNFDAENFPFFFTSLSVLLSEVINMDEYMAVNGYCVWMGHSQKMISPLLHRGSRSYYLKLLSMALHSCISESNTFCCFPPPPKKGAFLFSPCTVLMKME